jgi:hypothetical protein
LSKLEGFPGVEGSVDSRLSEADRPAGVPKLDAPVRALETEVLEKELDARELRQQPVSVG